MGWEELRGNIIYETKWPAQTQCARKLTIIIHSQCKARLSSWRRQHTTSSSLYVVVLIVIHDNNNNNEQRVFLLQRRQAKHKKAVAVDVDSSWFEFGRVRSYRQMLTVPETTSARSFHLND